MFWQDVVLSLGGGIDRNIIPTRTGTGAPSRMVMNTAAIPPDAYRIALQRADIGLTRPPS